MQLDEKRLQKKIEHWNKIIIGACKQFSRNKIPELVAPLTLDAWLTIDSGMTKNMLHPESGGSLSKLSKPKGETALLIGSEGGFSDHEINQARKADYQIISIGPRNLRTKTAALAVISACQALWGGFL